MKTIPNWCNGVVTVSGKPENIKEFCKLFVFEEDIGDDNIKRKYFARSFIHSKWEDFEEEYLKDSPCAIQFIVDFAWSAWSCLIEGYPQDNPKSCITLKSACKKYNVKVGIITEEPGMGFEEEISANKNNVKYSEEKMKLYECICGDTQLVISNLNFKEVQCDECGKVGKFQHDLLKGV